MIFDILRYTVFGVFMLATAAAVGSWALRTRRINPFSKSAQLIRRTTDPILKPVEGWVFRHGGNPQNAGWWLLGGTLVGGIVLLSVVGYLAERAFEVGSATRRGPFAIIRLVVFYAGQLISLAIFVRVIGSWLGVGRFNRWMRPAYFLTDWIVEPLRRFIPPIGMFDVTPIVAFLLIRLAMALIFGF